MRIERLGDLGGAPAVLRAVADAAARHGLAAPAALIGEWFGSGAVIAPSVAVTAVGVGDVFDVRPGPGTGAVGGGWFGYLSYPDAGADGLGPRIPEAAGGWSDCVLRQDRDGLWWYESLTGAAISTWVADALRAPVAPGRFEMAWGDADRDAHRHGVLACLEAIAAGEVYQACVCTQFAGRIHGAPMDFFVDAVQRTSPARAAY
ncbi:MAG TPA: aminodeoxychorismate synthase component I, partial [Mycobacterium sp.]|nr:aminodeoxychorismate synthase component I [Mycobacterium sp.]